MKFENITDLHNRLGNIGYVARRCQEHLYPLLVWPEDKHLLRLTDLPLIQGRQVNLPETWIDVQQEAEFTVSNDACLRHYIHEGYAYYRSFVNHFGLTVVRELKVETR